MAKISMIQNFAPSAALVFRTAPTGSSKDDDEITLWIEGEEKCILCGECVDNYPSNAVKHKFHLILF